MTTSPIIQLWRLITSGDHPEAIRRLGAMPVGQRQNIHRTAQHLADLASPDGWCPTCGGHVPRADCVRHGDQRYHRDCT